MVDFDALLNMDASKVERPRPIPSGQYMLLVESHEFGKSSKKETDYVRFHFKVMEAGADIDSDLLKGVDLSKKRLRKDFYITNDALYRLVKFLEVCGLNLDGRSIKAVIPDTKGSVVRANVKQVPSQEKDSDDIFNEVTSFAKV